MKVVDIGLKKDGSAVMSMDRSIPAGAMLAALRKVNEVKVKVYEVEVATTTHRYLVTTGARETFLSFGHMGTEAQRALMNLINHSTQGVSKVLIILHEQKNIGGLICTVGREDEGAGILHVNLSPAYGEKVD